MHNRNRIPTERLSYQYTKDTFRYRDISVATSEDRDEDDALDLTSTVDENEKRRPNIVSKATKEMLLRHRRPKIQNASESETCKSLQTENSKDASKMTSETSFRIRRGHAQFSYDAKVSHVKSDSEQKSATKPQEKPKMSTKQVLATTSLSQEIQQQQNITDSPNANERIRSAAAAESIDTNILHVRQLDYDTPAPESPRGSRMLRKLEKIRKLKPAKKVDAVVSQKPSSGNNGSLNIEKESVRARRSLSNARSRVTKSLLGKIRSTTPSRESSEKFETKETQSNTNDVVHVNEPRHKSFRNRINRSPLRAVAVKS